MNVFAETRPTCVKSVSVEWSIEIFQRINTTGVIWWYPAANTRAKLMRIVQIYPGVGKQCVKNTQYLHTQKLPSFYNNMFLTTDPNGCAATIVLMHWPNDVWICYSHAENAHIAIVCTYYYTVYISSCVANEINRPWIELGAPSPHRTHCEFASRWP